MRVRPANEIDPRVTEWLWNNRIPKGMITIVAGMPDGGKSLFTIYLAAQVSRKADVILLAREDPAHQILRPRLEAAGAALDRIHIVDNATLPSHLDLLEQLIVENEAGLLIVDPVASHLDRNVSRYNDSIRQATDPLTDVAERTGVAVVMIEHTLKSVSKNAHPLAAIGGGSSGLRAAARLAYIGGRNPDNDEEFVLCCIKANMIEQPVPLIFKISSSEFTDAKRRTRKATTGRLTLSEEREFNVMSLLVGKASKIGRPPTKVIEAAEWLTEYLSQKPEQKALATDVVASAIKRGYPQRTLERAAKTLTIERKQKKSETGVNQWWWTLIS